jgi:alkylation response protein AidB-like acyl-CoA dehydrogenase
MSGVAGVDQASPPTAPSLDDRIDSFLAAFPPATTDPTVFWGAQFDRGLANVSFPVDCGGLGLPPDAQRHADVRLAGAGAPRNETLNLIGLKMMAPLVVGHGRADQRARYLRPAFVCDEIWCQLFSEPDAGSDLASLKTTAVRDGDTWLVNGQKVWTTMAHRARWGLLLARTDPDQARHRGLTYFIVDMQSPGIDVRPLRQITGEAEYNEVFLSDVRVPDSQRLAEPGDGWKLAMETLLAEREALAGLKTVVAGLADAAVSMWRAAPDAARTACRRDHLARLVSDARMFGYLVAAAEARGQTPEGPIVKLLYGSYWQRLAAFCMELGGPASTLIADYEMTQPTYFTSTHEADLASGDLAKSFLAAQALTIAGGTSNINKNIIAERLLGLPPEPRA